MSSESKETLSGELVSAKTLAGIMDVKIRTIREWVTRARLKSSPDAIPFVQVPGSRLIRFPLNEVRQWYERGRPKDHF